PNERLDLYAFLWQLGKPGPYDATKQNVARLWRVNTKFGTANAEEVLQADVRGKDWVPISSTVAGNLLKNELAEGQEARKDAFFAATRFQTSRPGMVR